MVSMTALMVVSTIFPAACDADFVADRVLPWGWVEIFRLYQNLERGL